MVVVLLPDPFRGKGGTEGFRGEPSVCPRPKVWTGDQNERSSAKDGAPE